MKIISGKFGDYIHTLPFVKYFFLFVTQLGFFNFNIVFFSQPTKSFRIGVVLVFHQKTNDISTFPGTEIFPNLFDGRYHKRRCFFLCKRTQTFKVSTRLLQIHKFANNFFYPSSFKNLIYG